MHLLQNRLQLAVVLDDAVVHDADGLVRGEVRVGVLVIRRTVGRPAGVRDADIRSAVLRLGGGSQVRDLASLLDDGHSGGAGLNEANTGRVVAAVGTAQAGTANRGMNYLTLTPMGLCPQPADRTPTRIRMTALTGTQGAAVRATGSPAPVGDLDKP